MQIAVMLPKKDTNEVKDVLMDIIVKKYPNLTISGITKDSHYDYFQGIHNAGPNSVIVIGDENHYNVDWYPNRKEAQMDGVGNFIDLNYNLNLFKIDQFLKELSSRKSMFDTSSMRPDFSSAYSRPVIECTTCVSTFKRRTRPTNTHSNYVYNRTDGVFVLKGIEKKEPKRELIGFLLV